ncbi:CynX/NimT family MFS transporter [Chachezhania antarctica]|uniref:MFS transporter n=1 Tax=Chachezhania antarctica TaxID=2340860 RepID=UPI000EAC6851|nr:MFS transporter [Chachezhania antarctica]|tara:strand:+ start:615 stop:1826 length:1212 start_codon:yes stop_codon:yes gene_type:complete
MTSDVHDSTYSWIRLGFTILTGVMANCGMWVIVVIMPSVETDFGATRAAASMPYILTMIGFAVGNLLIGRVIDRFGAPRALVGAGLCISAGYALSAIAPSIWVLSACHLLLGLGTAVGFGPLIADISHWFLRRRGIAVGLAASSNYVSGVLASMFASALLADYDWRTVYFVFAVLTVSTILPLSLLFRRKLPLDAHGAAEAQSAINRRSTGMSPRVLAWMLGLAGIGCCVAMSMPQVHIVAYCIGLGYGPATGAEMLTLMLAGGVISRVASGFIADRLGGVATLLIGSVLQCIALALFLPWDGLVPLYVISTVFGLSQGGIVPSYAVVVREYMPPREAGARVGFVLMLTILGMALGGWMAGVIYDLTGSYRLAFINGVAWNGLNIAIMLFLILRSRPPQAVPA